MVGSGKEPGGWCTSQPEKIDVARALKHGAVVVRTGHF
jgi:hypothetical protein